MHTTKPLNQIDLNNAAEILSEMEARRKNIDLFVGSLYKNIFADEIETLNNAYMKLKHPAK